MHRYVGYGLNVCSELEIPEFDLCTECSERPDVTVRVSHVPLDGYPLSEYTSDLPPRKVTVHGSGFVLRIRDGDSIDVWQNDNSDPHYARAVLVGIGFSVLLYQRGAWPLHVSAVGTACGVWLFGGGSGAGKSTIATWLHLRHGFEHMGDDAGVVRLGNSGFAYESGSRAIRLAPKAVTEFLSDFGHSEVLETPAEDLKVKVRLRGKVRSNLPILGLIMLRDRTDPVASTRMLRGANALMAVRETIFRPFGGLEFRSAVDTLKFCGDFIKRVPVFEFRRHRDFGVIDSESVSLLALIAHDLSENRTGIV